MAFFDHESIPIRDEKMIQAAQGLKFLKPIKAGEPLTSENIRVIRPGFGLPPKHLPDVIGRTAARDIAYGEALKWSAIA